MGLGHFGGGVEAARWLARQGAVVTVTDLADENELAESLAGLRGEPIARFHLGGIGKRIFAAPIWSWSIRPSGPATRFFGLPGSRARG